MKKFIAFIFLTILVISTSGCSSNQDKSELPNINASAASDNSYENDINGLKKYLVDTGCITGEPIQMSFAIVGAKDGYRYNFDSITVELYEFDTGNLNSTASNIVSSIKESGTFKMLDKDVEAYLSNNEKFMLIYTDITNTEQRQERKSQVIEIFKNFNS